MKRKIFFTVSLILASAFSSGFMLSGKKWKEAFPLVDFKINPEGFGVSADSAMKKILTASSNWSFQESETHFHFSYKGQTNITDMQSLVASGINCSEEGKKAAKALTNTIYSKSSFDPDCTGPACSYVWSCGDEIIHFDIQINSGNQPVNFSETPNPNALDALAVISEQFGYALGLDNCSPTDTPAQCLAKSTNGQSDPPADSAMSKLKFPGTIFSNLSLDDKSGIRSIYGNFTDEEVNRIAEMKNFSNYINSICQSPCVIPGEDSSYPLSGEEQNSINTHQQHLINQGLFTNEDRFLAKLGDQNQYLHAFANNQSSPEGYLKGKLEIRSYLNSKMDTDILRGSRSMLASQISEKDFAVKNFKDRLDPLYIRFLESELKMLIQIRRDIINEQSKR